MKKLFFTLMALVLVQLANAQCNISFTIAGSTTSLQATLTNTSSVAVGPNSVPAFYIMWGDNTTSTTLLGGTPTHTYSAAGTYTVVMSLNYVDSSTMITCNGSYTQTVTVANSPCATTISKTNNGNGSYTFTATNIGGGSGLTYFWDFGDGSTGTGNPVNHTYATSGNYTVILITTGSGCTYTSTTTVQYFNGQLNCASLTAGFTSSVSGNVATFMNTSTQAGSVPGTYITNNADWDFGDGSSSSNPFFASHAYTTGGTYTVTLINYWVDSMTNALYCSDTISQQVTVSTPPNVISGHITWDSVSANLTQASFKVWLIEYDANQNTLTAIDSTLASGNGGMYSFSNIAPGSYRTKAAVVNGTNGAGTLIPTYHDSATYWNNALVITHTGGSSTNKNIYMVAGNFAGGPGFIGGNISLGANKGTNAGVPGILVMLRNATTNDLVRFTYTDANGDYSFGNIPAGSYNIFPEDMNYLTIPSSTIVLASGQYNVTGINFKQTPTHIKPIPTGISSVAQNNLFNIYPNPSHGKVQINWVTDVTSSATIEVVDMTGRKVYSTTAETNQSKVLNLSNLQSGAYFIKVVTDKAQHSEKIMIQH